MNSFKKKKKKRKKNRRNHVQHQTHAHKAQQRIIRRWNEPNVFPGDRNTQHNTTQPSRLANKSCKFDVRQDREVGKNGNLLEFRPQSC